ncbi:hypothetical protein [Mesoflavibacter sp. CH_XMU1404-2]|uniref:hypothetical protein n=1 Tax=Mesoflavibacter sp. CH_XMU1404-2 TaxID=3107766 RepID=UPI0030091CC3
MDRLIKIDNDFTLQIEKLEKQFEAKDFIEFTEFRLSGKKEINFDKLNKTKGIYLFEIKNSKSLFFQDWIIEFKNNFKIPKHNYSQNWAPNISKSRLKTYSNEKLNWIPLYLGKSENMKKRINEHIDSNIGKAPSALKLKQRYNLSEELFRLKYIKLCNLNNYTTISSIVEKQLQNKIKPIVGR